MKRALVALIAGTLLSGLAAAYATTNQSIADEKVAMAAVADGR